MKMVLGNYEADAKYMKKMITERRGNISETLPKPIRFL